MPGAGQCELFIPSLPLGTLGVTQLHSTTTLLAFVVSNPGGIEGVEEGSCWGEMGYLEVLRTGKGLNESSQN